MTKYMRFFKEFGTAASLINYYKLNVSFKTGESITKRSDQKKKVR